MRLSIATLAAVAATVSLAHSAPPKREHLNPFAIEHAPLTHESGAWDLDVIDARLKQCTVHKQLDAIVAENESDSESVVERLFSMLFPFGPAMNALLATTYISGPPNLLLALIPPNIDPNSLSTLVSFAVGGLLGDVFLHLLPQTFVGEVHDEGVRFVLVDEKRNIVLGLAMFVGFAMFITLDKGMRLMSGSDGEGHAHSHSHSHSHHDTAGESSAVTEKKELRKRTGKNGEKEQQVLEVKEEKEVGQSVKLSAYLNLIADFTHNITDGLAIAASFYVSKSVGATTCLAVFFHEIPHEVGDFALLIQGGFSKSKAMQAQFVTAIGAYMGTFIGIAIDYFASSSGTSTAFSGIFGTTVTPGDLVLPFTAGGFLYIATVGVIPEILESGEGLSHAARVKQSLGQLAAMIVGIALMFVISWTE